MYIRLELIKKENSYTLTDRIGRLCHIRHGFLKFSLISYNSDRKCSGKVM